MKKELFIIFTVLLLINVSPVDALSFADVKDFFTDFFEQFKSLFKKKAVGAPDVGGKGGGGNGNGGNGDGDCTGTATLDCYQWNGDETTCNAHSNSEAGGCSYISGPNYCTGTPTCSQLSADYCPDFGCSLEEPAVCGNDVIEGTEECDDGNKISGDGCSKTCKTEIMEDLGDNGDGEDINECEFGQTPPQKCAYTGPAGTEGVGECKAGFKSCKPNGEWSPCSGEVLPSDEVCNGKDDNCDGEGDGDVDEDACPDTEPPVVTLELPETGIYYPDSQITFKAAISDNNQNIKWNFTSDITGQIQAGEISEDTGIVEFITTLPKSEVSSIETHEITLNITDSAGLNDSANVEIIIKNENCEDGADNDNDGIIDDIDKDCSPGNTVSITKILSSNEAYTHKTINVDCKYFTDSSHSVGACVKLNVSNTPCLNSEVESEIDTVAFKGCEVGTEEVENANVTCYVSDECNIGSIVDPKTIDIVDFSICDDGNVGENNLTLKIEKPDNSDVFDLEEEINVEVEVENKNSYSDERSLDFIVEAWLYDLDEETKLDIDVSEAVTIDIREEETFNLNLTVPEDIDLDNINRLYVKAYRENREARICKSKSLSIFVNEDSCIDRDDDNYCRENDCDDEDENINPGAAEICNDGIDNDCNNLVDYADSDCLIVEPGPEIEEMGVGEVDSIGSLTTSGVRRLMAEASELDFNIENEQHSAVIKEITSNTVTITLNSEPFDVHLTMGQTRNVDVNGDEIEDLKITLNNIENGKADLTFNKLTTKPPLDDGVTDSDLDGMDDNWELSYFGTLAENADDDFDNDGFNNLEEFRRGTNPKVSDIIEAGVSKIIVTIVVLIVVLIAGFSIFIYLRKHNKKSKFVKQDSNKIKLIKYIKTCRKKGITDEEIKNRLLNVGWEKELIDEVLKR